MNAYSGQAVYFRIADVSKGILNSSGIWGFGTTSPNSYARMEIENNLTSATGYNLYIDTNIEYTDSGNSYDNRAINSLLYIEDTTAGNGTTGSISNLYLWTMNNDASAVNTVNGLSNVYGSYTSFTGTITTLKGLNLVPYVKGSGTITTMYDIYIAATSTGSTVGTRWGIYQAEANDNHFAGAIGIGKTPNASYDLDVDGAVNFDSTLTDDGAATLDDTVAFGTDGALNSQGRWTFGSTDTVSGVMHLVDHTSTGTYPTALEIKNALTLSGDYSSYPASAYIRMHMDGSGNITHYAVGTKSYTVATGSGTIADMRGIYIYYGTVGSFSGTMTKASGLMI